MSYQVAKVLIATMTSSGTCCNFCALTIPVLDCYSSRQLACCRRPRRVFNRKVLACASKENVRFCALLLGRHPPKLYDLPNKSWTFAIFMAMSTPMNTSYLNIGLYPQLIRPGIINFHILVLADYEQHIARVFFEKSAQYFDVIRPTWRDDIIAISTNRERIR